MRGKDVASLTTVTLFASLVGWSTAVPAVAGPGISYAGRGVAITETASGITTRVADTGELSSSGGALDASALSGGTSAVTAETLHASTIGQGDRTRSEGSLAQIALTVGVHQLAADFAMSRAEAVKHGGNVTLTGKSHVDSIVLDGLPVPVSGQPNQSVPLPDGLLVVNEQSTSASGGVQSITVNALHLTVGSVDVVLGTSKAGVSTGSNSCSGSQDQATGGGWIPPGGGLKRTFGFVGGVRANGTPHGHVVYRNHATDVRMAGTVDAYAANQAGTTRTMSGQGQSDGQPTAFSLTVTDNGEPGAGSTPDRFTLTFLNEVADGEIDGGNIQVHEVCS